MRDLKTGGVIQQVTSIGGQKGVPTLSIYCASKWAVEVFIIFIEHFNWMESRYGYRVSLKPFHKKSNLSGASSSLVSNLVASGPTGLDVAWISEIRNCHLYIFELATTDT